MSNEKFIEIFGYKCDCYEHDLKGTGVKTQYYNYDDGKLCIEIYPPNRHTMLWNVDVINRTTHKQYSGRGSTMELAQNDLIEDIVQESLKT